MDRRKKWNHSARAAVLSWALTFLVLQVGLSVSLDTWLQEWRDPHYTARHECFSRQVERHPDRPVIVVVGSSRTMNGLCPASLTDDERQPVLVNWGFPGHTPLHVALRAERLLSESPRPSALVLEIVPAFLNSPWTEPGPISTLAHRWDDLPTATRLVPVAHLERAWSDARIIPWFSYRRNILDWCFPAWQPAGERNDTFWRKIDDWGWFPTLATGPSLEARQQTVAGFTSMLKKPEIHPDQMRGLRSILATCRRENMPTAMLMMPESPALRTSYGPGTRAGLNAALQNLADEFGVQLIDARDWFDTEDVFCDGHHLVPVGARLFTARFAEEVVPRLLHGGVETRVGMVPAADATQSK